MRVLVTGGLGVIGSEFVRARLRRGDEVFVIDSAEEPRNVWIQKSLWSEPNCAKMTVRTERLETDDIEGYSLSQFELIVHAAAHTGIPHSATDPTDDWNSNVDATRNLLEALRKTSKAPPTVLMSSVKPYRVPLAPPLNWDGIDELQPLEPDEPYAASKMAQSALGMAYARSYGLPVTVLRFSNLYGPAPCHGPRHGWLTWFCISAAIGRHLEVQGDGHQVRDMLYSTDVIRALEAAAESIEFTRGNVYNVGGGKNNCISVRSAALRLEAKSGVGIVDGPGRKNEDRIFVTDHRKFTGLTGWEPTVDVWQGLDRVYAWASEHAKELKDLYGGV